MEILESSKRIGNVVPTSSGTHTGFFKIQDPEEARMVNQAKLAHQLRINFARGFLEGQSGSADSSERKSSTAGSSDGNSGTADSSAFFSQVAPVELQMYNKDRVMKLTYVVATHMVGETCHGTLEAHENGFIYKASGFSMVFMNANVRKCFWRLGDECPPLLLFHLQHPIMVGSRKMKDVQFFLMPTPLVTYPKDSNNVRSRNEDLKNFVNRVQQTQWNCWSSVPIIPIAFEALEDCEFDGAFPTGHIATIALTRFSLVVLVGRPFVVVPLRDIEIVNLALRRPQVIDMTIVLKDFKCPVLEIHSIPLKCLTSFKDRLNFADVKYYVNNVGPPNWNTSMRRYVKKESPPNWDILVKSIFENPEMLNMFIYNGGWESLGLEDSCTLTYYPVACADIQKYGSVTSVRF